MHPDETSSVGAVDRGRSTINTMAEDDGVRLMDFLSAFDINAGRDEGAQGKDTVVEEFVDEQLARDEHEAVDSRDRVRSTGVDAPDPSDMVVPEADGNSFSTVRRGTEQTLSNSRRLKSLSLEGRDETRQPTKTNERDVAFRWTGSSKVAPAEILDEEDIDHLKDNAGLILQESKTNTRQKLMLRAASEIGLSLRHTRQLARKAYLFVAHMALKTRFPGKFQHQQKKRILTKNPVQQKLRRRHLEHSGWDHVRFDLELRYEEDVTPWCKKTIDHTGAFGRRWFVVRVGLQIYTMFRFPYRLAFGPTKLRCPLVQAFGGGHRFVFREVVDYYSDFLPDLFFLADVVVNCFLSYDQVDTDERVADVVKIRARYFRRQRMLKSSMPSCWIDLAGIIPLHVVWNIPGVPEVAIQVASLPRLARIVKLFEWFGEIEFDAHMDFRVVALCKFLLMMFGMAHWIGCLWWLFARFRNFDDKTWVAQFDFAFSPTNSTIAEYDPPRNNWRNYQDALYWGFNSMTAFGYSDVLPNNGIECLFATSLCLVQLMYNAYILGTLFRCAVKRDEKSETHQKTIKYIENYAQARRLPSELVARMKRYIQFVASRESASQEHVLRRMPPTLVAKIAKWQHQKLLASTKIFNGVPEQYITLLLVRLRARYLQRGDILFKLGDMAHELCFIQSGSIDEFEDDARRRPIRSLTEGILGELAFFMGIGQPCCVAASQQTDVVLQSLSVEDYEDLLVSYAEGHSITTNNIMAEFNISSSKRDDDDAKKKSEKSKDIGGGGDDHRERVRMALVATLKRRQDDALSVAVEAASEGDLDTIRRVCQQGLDVNTGDYDGRTMLHLAAAEGNIKVVRLLLEEGADPSVGACTRNTSLTLLRS